MSTVVHDKKRPNDDKTTQIFEEILFVKSKSTTFVGRLCVCAHYIERAHEHIKRIEQKGIEQK